MRAARIAIAVAVIIAGYAGTLQLGFVAQVVAFAFGLAAASFFPAIVLGIFSKKMNMPGAIAGMITGLGIYRVVYHLLQVRRRHTGSVLVWNFPGGYRHLGYGA